MFHQHFNTPERGGAIRSYYLATALVKSGHQVVMITSSGDRTSQTVNVEGLDVVYLPIPYRNHFKFYTRSWAFVKFVLAAVRAGSRYKHFDRCYGISTPLTIGLCTWWMKFRYGIPYIFEVGDLWPDVPIQLGYINNPLFKTILFRFEKFIYQRAESVVVLSGDIQSAIERKVPGKPTHLIPNMADCEFYHPGDKQPDLELKFSTTDKMVVSYIGSIGAANGLDYLLEGAALILQAKLPIRFIVCGDGAELDHLRSTAKQRNLNNIMFTGLVDRKGVKEVMNVTDAAFVCYKNVHILETGCPNKFFDGLAGGKAIIVNFSGWIRNEIEENSCGLFVNPHDPADFLSKVSSLAADHKLVTDMGVESRQLAESKYSRKKLSESFAKLF